MKFCIECGTSAVDEARFCRKCGARLPEVSDDRKGDADFGLHPKESPKPALDLEIPESIEEDSGFEVPKGFVLETPGERRQAVTEKVELSAPGYGMEETTEKVELSAPGFGMEETTEKVELIAPESTREEVNIKPELKLNKRPQTVPALNKGVKATSGFAIASLATSCMGIFSGLLTLVFIGFSPVMGLIYLIPSALGIIFGIVGIAVTGVRGKRAGRGIAVTGLVLGIIFFLLWGALSYLLLSFASNYRDVILEYIRALLQ